MCAHVMNSWRCAGCVRDLGIVRVSSCSKGRRLPAQCVCLSAVIRVQWKRSGLLQYEPYMHAVCLQGL